MDPGNPVVQLCTQGMQAEGQGRADEARELFLQAWKAAKDDYEACIAAHYLARHQSTPEETLHWNQECLDRADRVGDERVRGFYASLHGNMGRSHLELGQVDRAREHFRQAARRVEDLPAGQYGDWLRYCIAEGLRSTRAATADDSADPVLEILGRLCARADLKALSLLLPAYMGDLGTADDRDRIITALQMLHAERRLPADEQAAVSQAIESRTAGM